MLEHAVRLCVHCFRTRRVVVLFIKPRVPLIQRPHTKPFSFGFLVSRSFMLYQLFNSAEAISFFLSGIYLPSYAQTVLGASPFPSVLMVLLLNVATVFGCVAMDSLIGRLHVTTCILVSTTGAMLGLSTMGLFEQLGGAVRLCYCV